MLYFNRIDVSEGIDVITNASKDCNISLLVFF